MFPDLGGEMKNAAKGVFNRMRAGSTGSKDQLTPLPEGFSKNRRPSRRALQYSESATPTGSKQDLKKEPKKQVKKDKKTPKGTHSVRQNSTISIELILT